jgi:hypothetical protein
MSVLPIATISKPHENEGIISTNTLPNLMITAHTHQKKSKKNLMKFLLN